MTSADIALFEGLGLKKTAAKELSLYGGGGEAYTAFPKSEEELLELADAFDRLGVKYNLVGGGSNVLIADKLLDYPLICTARLNGVEIECGVAYASCGARLATVIAAGRREGMGGLEFLSGIPATVGGAVKMNAGAFGSCIGDKLLFVKTLADGRIATLKADELGLGYRKGAQGIVLQAAIGLESKDPKTSESESAEYRRLRAQKQPTQPSLGSVFVNGDVPSGKLIEACGLKGARAGGACISTKHANFIVNMGGGSAEDYLKLMDIAADAVWKRFGVRLEREIRYLD